MNREQFIRANKQAFGINCAVLVVGVILMFFQGLKTGFTVVVIAELIAALIGFVAFGVGMTKGRDNKLGIICILKGAAFRKLGVECRVLKILHSDQVLALDYLLKGPGAPVTSAVQHLGPAIGDVQHLDRVNGQIDVPANGIVGVEDALVIEHILIGAVGIDVGTDIGIFPYLQ